MRPLIAAALGLCLQVAYAQDPEVAPFNFKPVVIDGSNSTGATVGIEFDLKKEFKKDLATQDDESEDIPEHITTGAALFGAKLAGTVALDKERNPKNFLDAMVDAKLRYFLARTGIAGGLFAGYETDQSFDNRQLTYGLRATGWKRNFPFRRDVLALDFNLGQVDPGEDKAREAALGSAGLEKYERWNIEFAYKTAIRWKGVQSLELNYRYFREVSPAEAVRAAGLHEHKLGTARIALKNDLFVAYSRGRLPFDRDSDKIFEVGWTHNLK